MLRTEKGITLVALIVTIIVLVILAAVSITAAYRSGIVNYATNGVIDYANQAKFENKILSDTESHTSSTINTVKSILSAAFDETSK